MKPSGLQFGGRARLASVPSKTHAHTHTGQDAAPGAFGWGEHSYPRKFPASLRNSRASALTSAPQLLTAALCVNLKPHHSRVPQCPSPGAPPSCPPGPSPLRARPGVLYPELHVSQLHTPTSHAVPLQGLALVAVPHHPVAVLLSSFPPEQNPAGSTPGLPARRPLPQAQACGRH